ncbi:hypothetical protein ABVT39_000491 [Epinephelus coioides]
MEALNKAAACRDFGDPVSITRLLPLTPNTPASFLRPSLSSSLTPPLLLLLSAQSQSSPLISTMLSVAGVSELFSGILITPRGARRPPTPGAQQEMSSGGEPPTAATESGKLLSPQREGKPSPLRLCTACGEAEEEKYMCDGEGSTHAARRLLDMNGDQQSSGVKLCSWREEEPLLSGGDLSAFRQSSDCMSKATTKPDPH